MTVPTVAFSVVMSGATPVTSAVSDNVPISIVKFTRTVASTCSSDLLRHRPEALKFGLDRRTGLAAARETCSVPASLLGISRAAFVPVLVAVTLRQE